MIRCNAKAKHSGKRCKYPVVPGMKKCRYHGGLSLKGPASKTWKTGMYSKYAHQFLSERVDEYLNDPRITDIKEALALQQAILAELLSKKKLTDKPKKLLDALDQISRNIERFHKITYGEKHTITVDGVRGLLNQIIEAANASIRNPDDRKRFVERLEKLVLI